MQTDRSIAEVVDIENDSLEAVNDYFIERKWSDGLPIVPPTFERVAAMLKYTDLPAELILGSMPPRWRPASVHHVAVNAVMAGCRPEYFPVVVAAVQAMLDPLFNLYGVQGTTNPAGTMALVNGPIARELDVNGGANVFGPGWQANATIGRALRLCLINVGGGLPGLGDMSTLGNPNKYTACIAENEAASPWEPYHIERGFDAGTSTVTMVASAAPQNVVELSADPIAILESLALAMMSSGSNNMYFDNEPMVVISPVQARHLAGGGFDKPKIRRYLYEHGRVEIKDWSYTTDLTVRKWKASCVRTENGKELLYPARRAEEIGVVVAGGDSGPHSAILATFNGTHLVTRAIAKSDGTPVRSVQDFISR